MKKLILLASLLVFTSIIIFAQSTPPQGISYQAVIRSATGAVATSQNVRLRLSIRDTTAAGTIVYQETHQATTNQQGLVNLIIGQGALISGTFASINWGTVNKFLQVEVDPAGGTNYTNIGTQQMMSVPYALYAKTAGSINNFIDTVTNSNNNSTILTGLTVPSYLKYYGNGQNGNKVCVNNELIQSNSNFKNLTIPVGITARVNPAVTSIIYVQDTLFLYGTINGNGGNATSSTMNSTNNHIGATSSGSESSSSWRWAPVGGGQNLTFSWTAAQQPSSYIFSLGGSMSLQAGIFGEICQSTSGQNFTISDLMKVIHFGLDISGVNGSGIQTIAGATSCGASLGVIARGGEGGAGVYIMAKNVILNGNINLKGGNGGFTSFTCSGNTYYATGGGGGGGSAVISTNNLISNSCEFNGSGGSQTATFSCNKVAGNGSMLILQ